MCENEHVIYLPHLQGPIHAAARRSASSLVLIESNLRRTPTSPRPHRSIPNTHTARSLSHTCSHDACCSARHRWTGITARPTNTTLASALNIAAGRISAHYSRLPGVKKPGVCIESGIGGYVHRYSICYPPPSFSRKPATAARCRKSNVQTPWGASPR